MNWKRALCVGILYYAASFIVGILIAMISGADFSTGTEVSASIWLTGIILSAVFAALFTWLYFKKEKPSAKAGFHLSLVYILVGIVFDMLFIIPYVLTQENPADIFSYYQNPFFWVTLAAIIGVTVLTGHLLEKKK